MSTPNSKYASPGRSTLWGGEGKVWVSDLKLYKLKMLNIWWAPPTLNMPPLVGVLFGGGGEGLGIWPEIVQIKNVKYMMSTPNSKYASPGRSTLLGGGEGKVWVSDLKLYKLKMLNIWWAPPTLNMPPLVGVLFGGGGGEGKVWVSDLKLYKLKMLNIWWAPPTLNMPPLVGVLFWGGGGGEGLGIWPEIVQIKNVKYMMSTPNSKYASPGRSTLWGDEDGLGVSPEIVQINKWFKQVD